MEITDKNYKVPEGFSPILWRSDDGSAPVVGFCRLEDEDIDFYIGDPPEVIPALPLRGSGKLWHKGWDIPTRWAIDANGQCWMNDAHGGELCLKKPKMLLAEAKDQKDRNYIKDLFGMKLEEPEWMAVARTVGWSPKDEFHKSIGLLLQLDTLEGAGLNQGTSEADLIRSEMQDLWSSLTDEEQELLDVFSAALRSEKIDRDLVKDIVCRLSGV